VNNGVEGDSECRADGYCVKLGNELRSRFHKPWNNELGHCVYDSIIEDTPGSSGSSHFKWHDRVPAGPALSGQPGPVSTEGGEVLLR